LEQDGGSDNCSGSEEDVVDWVDYVGGECIEGFVEVVLTVSIVFWYDTREEGEGTDHLDQDTTDDDYSKDIGTDMCQLVVSRKRQFQSYAESLDRQDSCPLQLLNDLHSQLTLMAMTETLPTREQTER
jgi:hypothetical protein